jgi:hypothetical protein
MTGNQDAAGSKFADELRVIVSKNIEANLQLANRISTMFWEGARMFGDRSVQPQQPRVIMNRMVQLNLSYYTLLTKHALAFGDEFATLAERALGTRPAEEVPPREVKASHVAESTTSPRSEINLEARVGETAAASFLVKNNQQLPFEVSFEASEIISRRGGSIRSPVVRFEPPHLFIRPGAQSTVTALIDISPEFKAGELYLLKVRLVGFEQKEVWIGIHVFPPAPAAVPKAFAPKTPGANKKKRRSGKAH